MGDCQISWQHTNRRQDSFVIDGRRRDLEEPVGYAEILRDLGGCPGIALLAIFLENTIADTSLRAVLGYPSASILAGSDCGWSREKVTSCSGTSSRLVLLVASVASKPV